MRITYLPWTVELWMCSGFWILILMTYLFWKEVLSGRYDPRFWDILGDDDNVPREEISAPHHILIKSKTKKKSVYDLIDDDNDRS